MTVETTFDFDYHLEVGGDLKPGAQVYYYPGASRESGSDGVLVEVINSLGESWTGIFAFGKFSPNGIIAVFQLPEINRFCVVSKGSGYVVSANDPNDWEEIPLVPILGSIVAESQELVIFANDTELCAYGSEGLRWVTERLSWHDLKIKELTELDVVAEYWDVRDEANREVRVNLKDGNAVGAAEII